MKLRTIVYILAAAKAIGSAVGRFLRNTPRTEHEARVFAHLNDLVETLINKALGRSFAPKPQLVVP